MAEPMYAQRYRARKRVPAGRAVDAFRGRDEKGRPVIVTVVRPLDPAGFLHTLEAVASVRHLDLAPVVDAGQEGPDCFVVQEAVEGADALALAQAGPLPVATAALITAAGAAGLAALHRRGVVHGGVDPTTVVRGEDGVVKLTGAGLAEAYPPPDLRPGTSPGIARYLSPEEVAGRAPSPASDVYRLGLVAYLLLTGRHAFDAEDGGLVAREQLEGVVRPAQLINPEVPPELSQIVARALDKDPGARGTAAQLQADIEGVLRGARVREAPPAPRRSRAWLWILLVVIAALVAAGAVWALTRGGGNDVTVPNVVGSSRNDAEDSLTAAGLKAGSVTHVQNNVAPAGTVVSQSPAAGSKAAKGSAVDLAVAGTPQPTASPATVPDVVGSTEASARAALQSLGFQVVTARTPSSSVAAGVVVSQAPLGGVSAAAGSEVSIVVSSGPATPASSPTGSPSP